MVLCGIKLAIKVQTERKRSSSLVFDRFFLKKSYLFCFPEFQGLACVSCSSGDHTLPISQICYLLTLKPSQILLDKSRCCPGLETKFSHQQQLLRIPQPSGLNSTLPCCCLSTIHAIKGKISPDVSMVLEHSRRAGSPHRSQQQ